MDPARARHPERFRCPWCKGTYWLGRGRKVYATTRDGGGPIFCEVDEQVDRPEWSCGTRFPRKIPSRVTCTLVVDSGMIWKNLEGLCRKAGVPTRQR